jgi:regulator of protease activity HflC (stomatin/prohibitin superfamily)
MEGGFGFGFGSAVSIFVVGLIAVGLYGCPQYNVYSQRMEGEATLAHSTYERQVQVQDAQGKLDAAKLLANVDIERARGVAEANKVIGSSLKDNEAYLRWLFVENLKETKDQVIYVPTEAQLPILEAGRATKGTQ